MGPLRGVLPIGPNGVPAFDTLAPSPLTDPKTRAITISYNYTLDLQGLYGDVSCAYDTISPITFLNVTGGSPFILQYIGSCPPGGDILLPPPLFIPVNSNNSLTFWACQSTTSGDSYVIYLRGRKFYETSIGNITCAVSPIQPATYGVKFASHPGIFTSEQRSAVFPNTSSELIQRAIKGVGDIVYESQNWQANLVAESVFTFGVKSFGLPPETQNDTYLRLYEAMIRGILEYEVFLTALCSFLVLTVSIIGHVYPSDIFYHHRSCPTFFLLSPGDRLC